MKTDGLTYERAAEVLRYEPETGTLMRKLKSGRWKICGDKPICEGYGRVVIDGKKYLPHRLVWLLDNREWPENEIDHIDRNKMNNKIENLREVSTAENQHNRGLQNNNSSGFVGVSIHRQTNQYRAQIRVNGGRIYLGFYATAEEAFLAYMIGKIEHHPTSPDSQQYLRELTLAG